MPWDLILWLAMATVILARAAAGLAQLGRIRQRCRRVTAAPVTALAAQLARDLGLPRPVTLLHGLIDGPPALPMTWGFVRPIVLLPTGFAGWPEERQRAVLLHELAHVKRGDWLIQLLARLACALYWFHPLVWWAARRLRIESEQACDDCVLTAGIQASDYATQLLEVVRATRLSRGSVRAAVSMAQGPLIERRVRAILDARRRRHETSRRGAVLAWVAAVGILPPLAAVRVFARTPSAPPDTLPAAAPAFRIPSADTVRVEIRDVTAPPAAPLAAAAPSPAPPCSPLSSPPLSPSPPSAPSPPPFPPAPYLGPSAPRAGMSGALAFALPVRVQAPVLSPSVVLTVAARSAVAAHAAVAVAARSAAVAHLAVAVSARIAAVAAVAARAERCDAPPREPNLSDKDLSGVDLSGRDLSGKDLSGKNLSGANLSGTKLTDANLSGTDLSGANLANADLSHAKMNHVDLSGSNLTDARLGGVDLTGVDLSGANLSRVKTDGLTLAHADLSGCNLGAINLSGMNLSGTIFSGANLAGAKLSGANLTKSDLAGANLGNADLSHARLTNADLSGANLNGTKLDGADLNGADVSGTKLDKSKSE